MKIVILAAEGEKANILYHTLANRYDVCKAVIEAPVPKRQLIRRRIRKLGINKVIGQLLFKLFIVKRLEQTAKERVAEIKAQYAMNAQAIPEELIERVTTVNDAHCIRLLQTLQPDLIVVNGTRIISREVLQTIKVPFLNMHAGITPLYRGVHGGYWALAMQDKEHCGVTVHLIDEGIDTGAILYQSLITVTDRDNFVTYPYLQFALGQQDMLRAIEDYKGAGLHTTNAALPSAFRTHPTLWEYLSYRKKYGVQ